MTAPTPEPPRTSPRLRAPLAVCLLGLAGLGAIALMSPGLRGAALTMDAISGIVPVSAPLPSPEEELARACDVTGCDADDLSRLFRAGLPAMDADELADAAALTRLVAEQSRHTLVHARELDADIDILVRLEAQAAADAAVARLHDDELVRRGGL